MSIITVPFPLKGQNKNWAYSKQPPLTTPYILNMRPYDVDGEGRCRGGSSVAPPALTDHSSVNAFGTDYSLSDYETLLPDAPEDATVMALYRGRIVFAGPADGVGDVPADLQGSVAANNIWDDYQWVMSRQGDVEDYTFAADDAQTPIAGSCCDAGRIPDKIKAIAPFSDDYCIIGCESSVWVIRGDPAWGGSIDVIMNSDGIFGNNAWCFDQDGNFYFANYTGLYMLPRGLGALRNLSRDKIPNIFADISAAHKAEVNLAYDYENQGISISCPGLGDPAGDYGRYWYDLRTSGFFPEEDGVTESSESEVMYGPIAMASDECQRGKVLNLSITTGGSGSVDYTIYTANSAIELEALVRSGVEDSGGGSLVGFGRQDVIGPPGVPPSSGDLLLTGAYLAIKFIGTAFVLENVVVEIEPIGDMVVTANGKPIGNPIRPLVTPNSTTYGPFGIVGEGFTRGKVREIVVATSKDANGYLYVGNSKMEVLAAIAAESYSWTTEFSEDALSNILHPNISGSYAALVFDKDTIEEVTIGIEPTGHLVVTSDGKPMQADINPIIGPSTASYGPFAIAGEGFSRGRIAELAVSLSTATAGSVYVGDTKKAVRDKITAATPDWSYSFTDGTVQRPDVYGTYASIVFSDPDIERVRVGIEPVGQLSVTQQGQFIASAINPVIGPSTTTFNPFRIVGNDFSKAKIVEIAVISSTDTNCKIFTGHSELEVKDKVLADSNDWTGLFVVYNRSMLYPNVSGVYAAITFDTATIEQISIKVEPIGQLIVTRQGETLGGKLNPVIGPDSMIYGPFPIAGDGFNKGRITDLTVTQAESSGNIRCKLYVANSEVEVRDEIGGPADWAKSFNDSGAKSSVEHPNLSGVFAAILFSKPLIENVIIGVEPVGVLTVTYHGRSPRFVQPVIGTERTVYGPFSTGGKYGKAGKITELSVAKNSTSSNIGCYLFAGDSLLEVRNAMRNLHEAKWNRTLVAGDGRKLSHRPYVRAGFAAVILDNSDIEEMYINVEPAGNLRTL